MSATVTHNVRAFDAAAASYDETFERSFITEHIRKIVSDRMLYHFHGGQRVLDINCGTGTDAILLAQNGISVTALDASPKMIEITKAKSLTLGVGDLVEARVSSYENLDVVHQQSYDGAISNFGGLNCTADLEAVAEHVCKLLKPGGVFIACVMNKVCLWEISSFLARGKFKEGFRRFHGDGVDARIADTTVHSWYYTPRQFIKRISHWFDIETVYGINILSPSPNSRSFASNYPQLTRNLLRFDDRVRHIYPFNALGDHFVIEGRRRSQ